MRSFSKGLLCLVACIFCATMFLAEERANSATVSTLDPAPVIFPRILGCTEHSSAVELADTIKQYGTKYRSSLVLMKLDALKDCQMYYEMAFQAEDLGNVQYVPIKGGKQQMIVEIVLPIPDKENELKFETETVYMVPVPIDLINEIFRRCRFPNDIMQDERSTGMNSLEHCWLDL